MNRMLPAPLWVTLFTSLLLSCVANTAQPSEGTKAFDSGVECLNPACCPDACKADGVVLSDCLTQLPPECSVYDRRTWIVTKTDLANYVCAATDQLNILFTGFGEYINSTQFVLKIPDADPACLLDGASKGIPTIGTPPDGCSPVIDGTPLDDHAISYELNGIRAVLSLWNATTDTLGVTVDFARCRAIDLAGAEAEAVGKKVVYGRKITPTQSYGCRDSSDLSCCPTESCAPQMDDSTVVNCLRAISNSCVIDMRANYHVVTEYLEDYLCLGPSNSTNIDFGGLGLEGSYYSVVVDGVMAECAVTSSDQGAAQIDSACAPVSGNPIQNVTFVDTVLSIPNVFNKDTGASVNFSCPVSWADNATADVDGIVQSAGGAAIPPGQVSYSCADPSDAICCPRACSSISNAEELGVCLQVMKSSCHIIETIEFSIKGADIDNYGCGAGDILALSAGFLGVDGYTDGMTVVAKGIVLDSGCNGAIVSARRANISVLPFAGKCPALQGTALASSDYALEGSDLIINRGVMNSANTGVTVQFAANANATCSVGVDDTTQITATISKFHWGQAAIKYGCGDPRNLTCCPPRTCDSIPDAEALQTCLDSIDQSCMVHETATWNLDALTTDEFLCVNSAATNLNMFFDQFGEYNYALRAYIMGLPSSCVLLSAWVGKIPLLGDACETMTDGEEGPDLLFWFQDGILDLLFSPTSGVSSVFTECGPVDETSLTMKVEGIKRHRGRLPELPISFKYECFDADDDFCCPEECQVSGDGEYASCLKALPSSCQLHEFAFWKFNSSRVRDVICTDDGTQLSIQFTAFGDYSPDQAIVFDLPETCKVVAAYAGTELDVDPSGICVGTNKTEITNAIRFSKGLLTVPDGYVAASTGITAVFDSCTLTDEIIGNTSATISGSRALQGWSTSTTTSTSSLTTTTARTAILTTEDALTNLAAWGIVCVLLIILAVDVEV